MVPSYSMLLLSFLFLSAAAGAFASRSHRNVDYTAEAREDRVSDPLPGSNSRASFGHYAGYVVVNETAGRALFYWLTEAEKDSSSKPLVLWLSGGPGCSSVGYGGMQEIGPFHFRNSKVVRNPYSWNKAANLLFLDSPAGVGFSYSNTSSDLETPGDASTARDSLVFLQHWFKRFPNYRKRDFYLTGESYAGNYVPQLAKLIHEHNKHQPRHSVINLKGFMVGNALLNHDTDKLGKVDYWFSHALISHRTHRTLIRSCNLRGHKRGTAEECEAAVQYALVHEFGGIDPYNIYASTCSSPGSKFHEYVWRGSTTYRGYDPCVEYNVRDYFNKPEVQKAFHANVSRSILYPWAGCSGDVFTNWQDSSLSMLHIYKELIDAGLRIWVYSGDVDAVVPVTSSRYSIEKLNLTIATPWFPWYRHEEVGGYSEIYQGLTFVTIRGAGHEVPMFQPARALSLVEAFLAGGQMPKKPEKILGNS